VPVVVSSFSVGLFTIVVDSVGSSVDIEVVVSMVLLGNCSVSVDVRIGVVDASVVLSVSYKLVVVYSVVDSKISVSSVG